VSLRAPRRCREDLRVNEIRFDHVWKLFEGNAVVSDLNLEIPCGEFLVLVGPSGCGKTTSLRMLAGLERPSHGRIWIGDKDVTDVPTGQRDFSMVFQSYALYPNMTVYKNLAFGPKVRKEPRDTLRQRILDVADLLEIRHLLDRAPAALSGGQRQRVALGRALIREP
jgi:multiple sugar transport system ATP-binding protein